MRACACLLDGYGFCMLVDMDKMDMDKADGYV